MQIKDSKPVIVGVGTFMAASLGVALSASIDEDANDLFVAASLDDIDVLTADDDDDEEEASCGEGQCGEGDDEGECGEGECGEDGEEGDDEDEDGDDEDEDADDEEESTEE